MPSFLMIEEGSYSNAIFWKTIFSEHLKNISYFHVFFLKRSSFIFRKKNKIIFFGKRNIIFPGDKRTIIFQCDFFWKDHLFRTFGKIYVFCVFINLCFYAVRKLMIMNGSLHLRRNLGRLYLTRE